MYYEVYIDVFFVINAMLDVFILEITRKIQCYRSTWLRILLAAAAGSMVLCVFLCIPARKYLPVRALFYGVAYGGMAYVAFSGSRRRGFLRSVITLYMVSLLVNGLYRWLSIRIEHMFDLLAVGSAGYLLFRAVCFFYRRSGLQETDICLVTIRYGTNAFTLKGLWDTGNRLRSPYSGKGISVIDYEVMKPYLSKQVKGCVEGGGFADAGMAALSEKIFFVPYESVGCERGLLPVIAAESMRVERNGEELEYRSPLLGISRKAVSKRKVFQIILTTDGS